MPVPKFCEYGEYVSFEHLLLSYLYLGDHSPLLPSLFIFLFFYFFFFFFALECISEFVEKASQERFED